MGTIGAIATLILTPIIWVLYHKIFSVTYFGSMGASIFKELVGCFFVALLLVSFLGATGGAILAGVGTLLKFLFKAALIIVGISLVVLLIKKVTSSKDGKVIDDSTNGDTETTEEKPAVNNTDSDSKEITNKVEQTPDVRTDGELSVEEYILKNYKDQYVEALRYYRAQTNADLNTAKAVVDNLLASK